MTAKTPTAKTIKRETKLEVRIGLAEDEREPLTMDLLAELAEKEALAKEAKQNAATYRKSINDHEKKIVDLRTTLEQGKPELKDVIAHINFSEGKVRYQDVVTKKFYKAHEREVTDEDRQGTIGDEEGTVTTKEDEHADARNVE